MQDVFDRHDLEADSGYELPRPRAQSANRRLAIIAGVLGVALVGVGGALELASKRDTGVPTITADSRPLRVRPENPGGMQVIGANEAGSDTGAEAMAPAAEAPDPGSLRAQQQAELAARTAPPASAPSANAPAALAQATKPPPATPTAPGSATALPKPPGGNLLARQGNAAADVPLPPLSGASHDESIGAARTASSAAAGAAPAAPPPASRPAAGRTTVAAATPAVSASAPATEVTPFDRAVEKPAATAAAPATGRKVVQLAAVGSEDAANSEWERLSKRMPDLLGGRHPEIVRYDRDGKVFWRLRTGGFADSADASAFCGRVKAKGANCAVF